MQRFFPFGFAQGQNDDVKNNTGGKSRLLGPLCGEEGGDALLQLVEVGLALIAGEDFAFRADEKADGKAEDVAVEAAEMLVSHDDGVGKLVLVDGLLDGRFVVVHGDAEDLKSLGAELCLPGGEARDLCDAGTAPCRPEVEEDELAAIVGETDLPAF